MKNTVLLVKNMVCHRCVLAIEDILRSLNIPFEKVLLGEIHLQKELSLELKNEFQVKLKAIGFELIDNHTKSLIEKMKHLITAKARNETQAGKVKLSSFLSDKVHHEYTYLSALFSSIEGRTIEKYFIEQRIEKVKELLVYDQLTLAEIADQLEYSSVAHLSQQFKKITGLTPSHFKQLGQRKRKGIDKV